MFLSRSRKLFIFRGLVIFVLLGIYKAHLEITDVKAAKLVSINAKRTEIPTFSVQSLTKNQPPAVVDSSRLRQINGLFDPNPKYPRKAPGVFL